MIIPTKLLLPNEQEIENALQAQLATLKEGLADVLAALLLLVIAFFSLVHGMLRLVFALLGLCLWSLALIIKLLYWLQAWAVARSSSSLHRR